MTVRRHESRDYEAARRIYTEAFKRPDRPEGEAGLFVALSEANDVIDELSFVAMADDEVVGHVTASRAKVGAHSVVAVGPVGVLPEYQGRRLGTAMMNALLDAAGAADVPLVVLLGSPRYYGRFGFRPAVELGVVPPDPEWGDAFQARPLRAYAAHIVGPFQYAPAFSS